MTPISIYKGKQIVRHSSQNPTPYLKKADTFLIDMVGKCVSHGVTPNAVDIGCGTGRNSNYLKELSFTVYSFDRKPDYGTQLELGNRLPITSGTIHVVLLQFVLMFLKRDIIKRVVKQAFEICADRAMIVIELATVKSSLYNETQLVGILEDIEKRAIQLGFTVHSIQKLKMIAIR